MNLRNFKSDILKTSGIENDGYELNAKLQIIEHKDFH